MGSTNAQTELQIPGLVSIHCAGEYSHDQADKHMCLCHQALKFSN